MSPESQNALSDAQRILQDDFPAVDAVRLSRVEARIRGEVEEKKKAWWLPLGLTAAVAAAVTLVVVVSGEESVGDFNQNGVIAWDSSSPKRTDLRTTLSKQPARIEQGNLRFEVNRLAQMKPFELETPHVDIATREARFSVNVDSEATRIAVEAGRVDVRTEPNQRWRAATGDEVFGKTKGSGKTVELQTSYQSAAAVKQSPKAEAQMVPQRRAVETEPKTPAVDPTPAIPVAQPKRPPATTPAVAVDSPKGSKLPNASELSAWMSAADAARRRGDFAGARTLYQKVAQAADVAGLKEEANLRWAQTARRLNRRQEALTALAGYTERGALLPERIALQARLHLDNGQPDRAARLITVRAPRPLALVVAEVAVAIAEAEEDASKVVDLCLLVRASASSTPSLKERARAVELKNRKKEMIDQ